VRSPHYRVAVADEIHFDRRMSDSEALMWRLEKDPHLASSYATFTVLDRPLDFDRFKRRMAIAIDHVPRLRQRVQPAPGSLAPPAWVDDANFDLDHHVRHMALPKPGNLRQLADLATLIAADPFDRVRPLWQFVVVDGLRGGKGGLIQKLHHTVTDGEGGVRLSLQYLDLERDAPGPTEIANRPEAERRGDDPAATVRDLIASGLRLPLALVKQVRDLLAEPARIPTVGLATLETVRSIVTQLSEHDKAHSPLWTTRSLRRHVEPIRFPLDDVKAASKALGGTINTAFISAAAAAAGEYHRKLDRPVDELRASMAISTRTSGSGSNAFSLARMLVPTSEMPIADRFRAITNATATARASSASASLSTVAALATTLPTSVLTRIARQQGETVDFATSNVRAAPISVYIAGAKVLENYPIGPLAGVAFNLTLLSYAGSLDMGLNLDPAPITEPTLLKNCVEAAFSELASLAP
jgi:diacylglycerol O-acyltransferase / wax synthase